MAEKQTTTPMRQERQEGRHAREEGSTQRGSSIGPLQRFADEMNRVLDEFGLGRGWITPRSEHNWFASPVFARSTEALWAPDIEVFQRGNELVIRADLPGLNKDEIKVDIKDDGIIIQGERHREHEETREGLYRSERSYGSFHRWVPLPDGAMTDQAKAHFKDGVLEVIMPAPPEHVTRGRRLEITDGITKK
jgi:HSP20 family protein